MAERYCVLRLRGVGAVDAASAAGFSGSAPSPKARRLWQICELLQEDASGFDRVEVRSELERKQRKLEKLKDECQALRRWMTAAELMGAA